MPLILWIINTWCLSKMVSDLGWEPLQKGMHFDLLAIHNIQDLVGLGGNKHWWNLWSNVKRTRGQQRLYQPTAIVTVYKNSFFPRPIRDSNLLLTKVIYAATQEEVRVNLADPVVINNYTTCFTVLVVHNSCKIPSLLVKRTFGEESWPFC